MVAKSFVTASISPWPYFLNTDSCPGKVTCGFIARISRAVAGSCTFIHRDRYAHVHGHIHACTLCTCTYIRVLLKCCTYIHVHIHACPLTSAPVHSHLTSLVPRGDAHRDAHQNAKQSAVARYCKEPRGYWSRGTGDSIIERPPAVEWVGGLSVCPRVC
jgi:hypothetical protein